MARLLSRSLLAVGLALALALPAAAALPGASSARLSADADADQPLKVAKRRRRKGKGKAKAKKAPPPPAPSTPAPPPPPEESSGAIMTTRRGPARVDFDDRLIQGQTNKSGAIYIFERKSSELHSMVRRRTTFRDEILRSID